MYSGTTLTPASGRILGAHQKLDRLARLRLKSLLGSRISSFPTIRQILHFEGNNGPDGIKRKSPAQDEPWHYINPKDEEDRQLIELIELHSSQLTEALRNNDKTRAAFEAAWLAHGLVDGLTPAHHFPYEETLAELRGGQDKSTRSTIKSKIVLPGETRVKQVKNNWRMWGPKGLLSTHGFFEFGVATMLVSMRSKQVPVSHADVLDLREHSVAELFVETAREIDALGIYDNYMKFGWTPRLARQVRTYLIPAIVRMVTIAWYASCQQAGITEEKR